MTIFKPTILIYLKHTMLKAVAVFRINLWLHLFHYHQAHLKYSIFTIIDGDELVSISFSFDSVVIEVLDYALQAGCSTLLVYPSRIRILNNLPLWRPHSSRPARISSSAT